MFEQSTSDAQPYTPAPDRDPHRCAWWPGCCNPDLRDKDNPQPAVIAEGMICEGCMWRLTKAVRWLPQDWQRLRDAIGDRGTGNQNTGSRSTTRELAIPLNVATDALMRRMVEAADRAASVVESELQMTGANRHRSDSPPDGRADRGYLGVRGSQPDDYRTVALAAQALLPSLDVLIESEPEDHLVWGPIPDADEEWDRHRGGRGQPRELVTLSGLDLARELVTINHRVGLQLGLSYLRHPSKIPCHRCGAETLGRDNGFWDIDCTTCGARYSEGEHGLLIRLLADEIRTEEEDHLLKYLLAEAYNRLDLLREPSPVLTELTLDEVQTVMTGGPEKVLELIRLVDESARARVLKSGDPKWPHPTPDDRQIGARQHEKQTAAKEKKMLALNPTTPRRRRTVKGAAR